MDDILIKQIALIDLCVVLGIGIAGLCLCFKIYVLDWNKEIKTNGDNKRNNK